MDSPAIPALASLTDASAVDQAISLLLEPSPILHSKLTPAVTRHIASAGVPDYYSQLIDLCADEISRWSLEDKAAFLGGHPLIGEVKNLSAMSAKEQGGKSVRTPAIVLRRLAHLNKLYSRLYPGLPYITFVAGRSRAAIVKEMEAVLGLPASPEPIPDDWQEVEKPELDSTEVHAKMQQWGSVEWQKEMKRALGDIWLIARSRLQGMGVQ
ncbi:hypothetical protein NliqN6_4111 [Naganishia liquefaciens]|uniref:Oxo-4-hydroxy-4-carboxy-5-ureidoimidazoline decarboxylase domain-containing protein n=1 Tax=Naganishia liquefaciens TaxID=104408 RepID=A0A8H3TWX9_9TREE|nr:hypothetical protein NliqN6_4111 [Naganishia liquefaciens]